MLKSLRNLFRRAKSLPENDLDWIPELERKLRKSGHHVGLTGSKLYGNAGGGGTGKDVDLIVYPHGPNNDNNVDTVDCVLRKFGMTFVRLAHASEYGPCNRSYVKEISNIRIYDYNGKRVDVQLRK